jgi:multidrug efflux pump subunit AcrA (membrane-fusion protein)
MARSRRVVAGAALAGALLTGALLAGCDRRGDTAAAKGVSPGVPVTVADVVTRDVPVQIRAIGNVQPLATVSVLSMINGEVMKVHWRGRRYPPDPPLHHRPALQAALLQAQATLAQHQAMEAAEANRAKDTAQLENARGRSSAKQALVDGVPGPRAVRPDQDYRADAERYHRSRPRRGDRQGVVRAMSRWRTCGAAPHIEIRAPSTAAPATRR